MAFLQSFTPVQKYKGVLQMQIKFRVVFFRIQYMKMQLLQNLGLSTFSPPAGKGIAGQRRF